MRYSPFVLHGGCVPQSVTMCRIQAQAETQSPQTFFRLLHSEARGSSRQCATHDQTDGAESQPHARLALKSKRLIDFCGHPADNSDKRRVADAQYVVGPRAMSLIVLSYLTSAFIFYLGDIPTK